MKNKILIIFLLFPIVIFAQPSKNKDRKILSTSDNLLIEFNALKDETSIYIYPYLVVVNEERSGLGCTYGGKLSISSGFIYKGKSIDVSTQQVELGISSAKVGRWLFKEKKERVMTIKLDGEEQILGELSLVKSFSNNFPNMSCADYYEDLAMLVPVSVIDQISKASKVSFKIGYYDFKLSKSNLEVFRKLNEKFKN